VLIAAVRWIGIILGAALSWFMAVGILMHLSVWGWHFIDLGLSWALSELHFLLHASEIDWTPPRYLAGSAPDISWSLHWTLMFALGGTAAGILLNCFTSLKSQCRREIGNVMWADSEVIPKGHFLDDEVRAIKKRFGAGGALEFRVVRTDAPIAFAMSAPFRSLIVMSSGLLNSLTPQERQWVMAHEMSHVKHRDSFMASVWIASMKALFAVRTMFVGLINLKIKIMIRLRIWASLIHLIVLFWKGVLSITNMGVRLGQLFFLVIDRWAARRIEFRADREAVAHFGVSPGVDVMKKLGGVGEPLFGGLFATHPKISERIVKMREKK